MEVLFALISIFGIFILVTRIFRRMRVKAELASKATCNERDVAYAIKQIGPMRDVIAGGGDRKVSGPAGGGMSKAIVIRW